MSAIDRAWAKRPKAEAAPEPQPTEPTPEPKKSPYSEAYARITKNRGAPAYEERTYAGWTALYWTQDNRSYLGEIKCLKDAYQAQAIFKIDGPWVLFRKSRRHDPNTPLSIDQATQMYGPHFGKMP